MTERKRPARRKQPVPSERQKARTGPPPALTHEQISDVVNHILRGGSPLAAAMAVGIGKRQHYRYLANAQEATAHPILLQYTAAIDKALGQLGMKMYETMHEAATGVEKIARWASGNPMLQDERGVVIPEGAMKAGTTGRVMMERVSGQWTAAARVMESFFADDFMRTTRLPVGAGAEGEDLAEPFTIVEVPSDRSAREIAEIERRVNERAGRA